MCWIFHETLPIWLPIRCPRKKIMYASWKVFKISWEPRNDHWFCLPPSVVLKIFDHWGDVLICLLINTSVPSHWLKSVAWSPGSVLKFRDIPDWLIDYYYYFIRYTSVIAIDFLPQHPSLKHGLWEATKVFTWRRGPTWEGGCRKESYFLEFMYVDFARDFVGVVFHVLLDDAM